MKRIITALLALTMLFLVVSCAKQPTSNNKPSGVTDEQLEELDGKKWDKHELDFEGYEFVILGKAKIGSAKGWGGDDLNIDQLTGDSVLDEVYNRNRLIEQTYNCIITSVESADIKTTVMAGSEKDGNMISYTMWNVFQLLESGFLLDLRDPRLTYLNLDKSWYNQSILADTTIAGKTCIINGDMLFTDNNALWITMFNKELAAQYIPDVNLYDLVKEGKWTVDRFMQYAKLATKEIVADDKMDWNDQWGYTGQSSNIEAFMVASGCRYAAVTADGGIETYVFTEKFREIFLKCFESVDHSFCIMESDIDGVANQWSAMLSIFPAGRALFSVSSMSDVLGHREMEMDFGVLPNPKLTEDQTEYYTWVTMNTNVVALPYYCENFERTSAIMEALFEESSYSLRGAYIDRALKYQATRDDESIEMIDIIMERPVYDIGFIYNFGGLQGTLSQLIKKRAVSSLSSTIKKAESKVNQDITTLLTTLGYYKT